MNRHDSTRTIRRICLALLLVACTAENQAPVLNDVHSRLNATRVARVEYPESTQDIIRIVLGAAETGQAISISGGRHSMGGQQFGTDTVHISMSSMDDLLALDSARGIVTVEAGILWPRLMERLEQLQPDEPDPWSIIQKQTGADQLSIGGALSTNIHGRGLLYRPLIQDVEGFRMVTADGRDISVSRTENPELFRLAIGGYGLFGVITQVDLRLQRRIRLRRDVEVISLRDLAAKLASRVRDGYLYGDFQFKTDDLADDFLTTGVFSTYRPDASDTTAGISQRELSPDNWRELLALAHFDKAQVFDNYSAYYLTTDGQLYWSDSHQLSYYDDGYETYLREALPDYTEGSLMISELYVPRARLTDFMTSVADDAREHAFEIIYGTVRLIKKDEESFLAWAKQDYACIIFNFRVPHTNAGIKKAQHDFRLLIGRALERGGSYFLTYHRWATKEQVLAAYPQLPQFLALKRRYDPEERFQSDWYRHYRDMLSDEIAAEMNP